MPLSSELLEFWASGVRGSVNDDRAIRELQMRWMELMAAGERLLLGLAVESDLCRYENLGKDNSLAPLWLECRSSVARLAEDYAAALEAFCKDVRP